MGLSYVPHTEGPRVDMYLCGCGFSGFLSDKKGNPIKETPQTGLKGYLEGNEYTFYFGAGWITLDERSELRQKEPRTAP